jgi:hypothetical protein
MSLDTLDIISIVGGASVIATIACVVWAPSCPVAAGLKLLHEAMQYKGPKTIVLEEDTKEESKPST